ncbi:MAG: hypothetical protein RLN72_02725, partial [Henriciella sp.]
MAPDAVGIRSAVGAVRAVELPVRWSELAESVNRGEPLGLVGSSPYAQQLTRHLQALNLLPFHDGGETADQPLRAWARKLLGVLP